MTHKEFMQRVIEYYGPYKQPAAGKMTYLHVVDNVIEDKLEALFEHIKGSVSIQYGNIIDSAAINRALGEIKEQAVRELPDYKKIGPPLNEEDYDKVAVFWRKMKEKYPVKKDRVAKGIEEARRELEEMRRKRENYG